jgi:hypothetical protein
MALNVTTQEVNLELTGYWWGDILAGFAAGVLPFGVLSTLVIPEFICMLPLSNIGVGLMNMIFLYLFFARHQVAMQLDSSLL